MPFSEARNPGSLATIPEADGGLATDRLAPTTEGSDHLGGYEGGGRGRHSRDDDGDLDDTFDPDEQRRESAKAALAGEFQWMPSQLRSIFIDAWVEHGDPHRALAEVREHPTYAQLFPGNLTDDGRVRMGEADYMRYRDTAQALHDSFGLPEGFLDTDEEVGRLIEGDVSIQELHSRIEEGWMASMSAPSEVRQELNAMFGISEGDLAAFWLDPDKAEPILQRRYSKAQVSAASRMTGFGRLTADEADRIVGMGVTDMQQAQQGLQEAARMQPIAQALPGQRGQGIDRDTILAAAFEGDVEAQEMLRRRQSERLAEFEGGGGTQLSMEGALGLRRH